MGTENSYPQRVSRLPTALSDEQKRLLAALRGKREKIRRDEAEYEQLLVQCKAADIPIAHIAEAAGVQRKTIYSQLERAHAEQ